MKLAKVLCAVLSMLLVTAANAQQKIDWPADVDFLVEQLAKRHKNAFHSLAKADWQQQADDLKSRIGKLNDYQAGVELSRLVAALGDGHTAVQLDFASWNALPVQFYQFKDGFFINRSNEKYKDAFGGRVTKIGDMKIERVLEKAKLYLSHDNDWQFKNQGPMLLGFGEMLHVIGAWNSNTSGTIAFEKDGKSETIKCDCIPMSAAKTVKWITRTGDAPKFRQKQQLPCWNDWLAGPDSKTMYFRYNRCENAQAFQRLVNGSKGFVEQQKGGVQRFVLDLRGNGGGNSTIFRPLLSYLKDNKTFNKKGKLIVITDRQTFSSAVLNAMEIRNAAETVFYGEPTGGKPNHFGEVRDFELLKSKLKIGYSTKHFVRIKDSDPPAVIPDIQIEPTFDDWLRGKDPVIEKILLAK